MRILLLLLAFVSFASFFSERGMADEPNTANRLPNILVVLADDLGFGDVSCNNPRSKIPTPHVARLAEEGMRFVDAHTPSAVCTPTRYGLLTGRYCWRTRLTERVLDGFDPPLIEPDRVTVASLLREQGYATACIGKWHLGMQWTDCDGEPVPAVPTDRRGPPRGGLEVDYTVPLAGGPTAVGFDRYFGISASLNMSPFCYLENDRPHRLPVLPQPRMRDANFMAVDEGVRSPDFTIHGVMPRLAGEAIGFIEQHVASHPNQPFFLYTALTSPHLPVVTNAEYRGKSEAGEYGDFVVETDAFLGAMLETLDRTGLADNTLVIFTSDNGGLYHYWQAQETDDVAHYKIRGRAAYIREFEHQSNAHLRGTKADIWEGGHRVPFIVRWPGHTPAGAVSEQLVELTDLIATAAAIVGVELPPGAGPDSRNILPALLESEPDEPVREFSIHHSLWGEFAIRQGPWKLIPSRGSGGFTVPRELDPETEGGPLGQLYHLESDPSETTNLYDDHPEVVARLGELLKTVQTNGS
ncbi:sulfatase family protein [Candidatus Laterigemmans baculatus]|uniref:sulfatase family protein n=1 Tax=Candidatus Laterigemmans baculatus TaxID=2770505 RepID=UPI0013DCA165|nr:arylsulfatase [Candidatus Laterigemmans baculatus]